MRWIVFFLLIAVGGCGRSFTELDAIYKDELSILDELRERHANDRERLKGEYQQRANNRWSEAAAKHDAAIRQWEQDRATAIQHWEGKHANEWVPKEYAARRAEFEKSLELAPVPPSESVSRQELQELTAKQKAVDDQYIPLIEAQEAKVDAAKKRRDAAK